MSVRRTLLALTLVLVLSAGARAATLSTPALFFYGGLVPQCLVSNVSDSAITVHITMYDNSGVVAGSGDRTVAAHSLGILQSTATSGLGLYRSCQFDVQGSKKKVRASLVMLYPAASPNQNSVDAN